MPSPFPGMDPYLEGSLWPDVHATLLVTLKFALVRALPEKYSALVGQYVWLEGADEDERAVLGVPDVQVSREGPEPVGGVIAPATTAPVVATLPAVRRTGHRYLRITDRERRRLVTVIELLSPTNKDSGKNRPHYLEKRNDYLATGVNLVEIDLLRAGERMPLGDPPSTPTDYYLLVARAVAFPRVELWPFSIRDVMPDLTVPLDKGDPDIRIGLKKCLEDCYDQGQYQRLLHYDRPPAPPLRKPDAEWAAAFLKKPVPKKKRK